jgi:hypothetical protein
MLNSEQEKLIERFSEYTAGIYNKWPEVSEVDAPNNIRLEDIYRKLYVRLAPDEPPLPSNWSYRLTAVSRRGDGIQGTREAYWMPDGREQRTFELLVTDKVYVVTRESDYEPEDHSWIFTVRAPTVAALELAVKELTRLLPPMPESKTNFTDDDREEVSLVEKTEELENLVRSKLFMSIIPVTGTFLSSLKEHLEKLPGITNLRNDFLYNLAECYCEYDEVHFDFKNYRFSVYNQNEEGKDEWDFYVKDAKCPEDIIFEVADYCQLFGKRKL